MENNFNLSPQQQENLLRMAGEKLGINPSDLKNQLQNGGLDKVLQNTNSGTAGQIAGILQNPQAIEELLKTPKAQMLLKALLGGK